MIHKNFHIEKHMCFKLYFFLFFLHFHKAELLIRISVNISPFTRPLDKEQHLALAV